METSIGKLPTGCYPQHHLSTELGYTQPQTVTDVVLIHIRARPNRMPDRQMILESNTKLPKQFHE